MKLRPLTFHYKPDYDKGTRTLQYGPMGQRDGSDDSKRVVGLSEVEKTLQRMWRRCLKTLARMPTVNRCKHKGRN
jgi:hypothetical protein